MNSQLNETVLPPTQENFLKVKAAIHSYIARLSADELVDVILQLAHPELYETEATE